MNARTYIITEGVHDVTFLGRLLVHKLNFQKASTLDQIDKGWQIWLETFKWPSQRKKDNKTIIDRLSVPAPVFFVRREPEHTVAIANADGIKNIADMLDLHVAAFHKDGTLPRAIGIVLDSDDNTPEARFASMGQALEAMSLPRPTAPGKVTRLTDPGKVSDITSVGIFVLPDGVNRGTLEDILLVAGSYVYPSLHTNADAFIRTCISGLAELNSKESAAIKKPAGPKKATVAAMASILKPGRAVQATLEDHRWVSPGTLALSEMQPCITFLEQLIEG